MKFPWKKTAPIHTTQHYLLKEVGRIADSVHTANSPLIYSLSQPYVELFTPAWGWRLA